jgi:cytoskeletal protein CcmA (bactofilin family)
VFKRRKSDDSETATPDEDPATLSPVGSASNRGNLGGPAARPRIFTADRSGQSVPGKVADAGLGVPPFRPAATKESEFMGRAPLNPLSAAIPTPQTAALRPGAASVGRSPVHDVTERRTLVVGRGISLQGTVQDAERLVVEGTVEASTIRATEVAIAHGGLFKGEIEVEDAEIAGTIDGTLTARGSLTVRTTGRVLGTARCRRLQVEDGGQITGRVEMITDSGSKVEPARVTTESAA